jgi:hypothetical protein
MPADSGALVQADVELVPCWRCERVFFALRILKIEIQQHRRRP